MLRMDRFFAFLRKELRELLPVWAFFLCTFALLRLTQIVALRHFDVYRQPPSLVIIGSLIVSKVVLIVDAFRFIELFGKKPLIYGTLWKTCIYWVGASIVYYAEGLFEHLRSHQSLVLANHQLMTEMSEPRFWVIELWLALLLFAYCATREIIRSVGKERFNDLFFGPVIHPLKRHASPRKAA